MGLTFFTTEERALNERFLHFMILLDLAFLGFIHEETGEELEYRAQMFRCRGLSITVRRFGPGYAITRKSHDKTAWPAEGGSPSSGTPTLQSTSHLCAASSDKPCMAHANLRK
eukprot:scaffold5221_cov397-Prasinococcus_capsulatus_cf.AAC.1